MYSCLNDPDFLGTHIVARPFFTWNNKYFNVCYQPGTKFKEFVFFRTVTEYPKHMDYYDKNDNTEVYTWRCDTATNMKGSYIALVVLTALAEVVAFLSILARDGDGDITDFSKRTVVGFLALIYYLIFDQSYREKFSKGSHRTSGGMICMTFIEIFTNIASICLVCITLAQLDLFYNGDGKPGARARYPSPDALSSDKVFYTMLFISLTSSFISIFGKFCCLLGCCTYCCPCFFVEPVRD